MIVDSASVILTQLLLNSAKLKTLKLDGCKLLEGPSSTINHHYMKMINLQVIHLSHVSIENRALNSMIAAAPLLEKLTLMVMNTVKKVEVCNNANLKHLQISYMNVSEIAGDLHSLETLSLSWLDCRDLEIICSSLLPSLKSLEIKHCPKLRSYAANKLISKSPSLLSLHLVRVNEGKELKIESPTLEKLELELYDWHSKSVLHIDAPSLVNVRFGGDIGYLHVISDATNSFQAAQIRSSTFELSLSRSMITNRNFKELKELVRKVSRKFQFVELQLNHILTSSSKSKDWDQVEDDSPTPIVERVEVKPRLTVPMDLNIFYYILWSCHPKYFSVRCDNYTLQLYSIELINKIFMERTSPSCKKKIVCKCWRHQLKDVKIVNTRDKVEEELMNVSNESLVALQSENQALYRLIWD
ncbi:hypothetical protein LINPERHAP2_LOCUS34571 [Linum perenne]